jgi:cytochrome P450
MRLQDSWQLRGRLQDNVSKIHFKYGDAVRIAPNELSFTSQQAWNDIYSVGKGKEQWPRHPRRVPQGKNAPMSIMNTVPREHARFRRLLNHAFSEKGLQEQAPIMNKYIDLLVKKIGILAEQGKSTDFTSWLHMCTFDIISDL